MADAVHDITDSSDAEHGELPPFAALHSKTHSDDLISDLIDFARALRLAIRGLGKQCEESEPNPGEFAALENLAWEVIARATVLEHRMDAGAIAEDQARRH